MKRKKLTELKAGDVFFRGDLMVGIKVKSENTGRKHLTCTRIKSGYDFIGNMRVEKASIIISLMMQIWEDGFKKEVKPMTVVVEHDRNVDVMVQRITQ